MKCLEELEASQWWPRDRIRELQNERLRKLIRHAYDNVPYYRRVFDERGLTPESIKDARDLVKLPVLNKQLIRAHFDALLAPGVHVNRRVHLYTGGSTGEPLQFYRTRGDQLNWGYAAAQRSYGWAGYRLGDRFAKLTVVRPYRSARLRMSETTKRFLERVLLLDAKKISVSSLPAYVRTLERYQPEFLLAYPSALETMAKFISRTGKPKFKPKAILTGAEQLYDYQRELFSSVFECDTFSYYGSWEANAIASECPEHTGLHIASENLIVEVVDDQGSPLPHGKEGQILITSLHNYAMPFIRYAIGDMAETVGDVCRCGRGLPLLGKLNGRTTEVVYTRSGKIISGTALLHVFLTPVGVSQFQFVQENYDKVTIRLVMDKDYSKEYLNELAENLSRRYKALLENDMNIGVEFVNAIPTTESGKRRVVISHVKSPP